MLYIDPMRVLKFATAKPKALMLTTFSYIRPVEGTESMEVKNDFHFQTWKLIFLPRVGYCFSNLFAYLTCSPQLRLKKIDCEPSLAHEIEK